MVVLSSSTILPSTKGSSSFRIHQNQSDLDDISVWTKSSHLHFEKRKISEIGEMCFCPRLNVLYLFDNQIERLQNMDFCRNLTQLYLQNNRIRRIENLFLLPQLEKLFLSGNCLSVVEGLENNRLLRELHVDHQNIGKGEGLVFDPRATEAVKESLEVLNISGNHISELSDIQKFTNLLSLYATKNIIKNLAPVLSVVEEMPRLLLLDLSGNPIVKTLRYKEQIMMATISLEELDGKVIKQNNREFLLRMKASRQSATQFSSSRHSHHQTKSYQNLDHVLPRTEISWKILTKGKTVQMRMKEDLSKIILPGLLRTTDSARRVPAAMVGHTLSTTKRASAQKAQQLDLYGQQDFRYYENPQLTPG